MAFTRSMGIGGSDVAAILGLSPYRTTFDVWLEKTGDQSFTPQEETPQMRFGTLMEPVLAKVYEEEHPGSQVILKGGAHSEPIWHPGKIVYAHIDGVVLTDGQGISGPEEGIWEGKTAWDDRDWPTGPDGEMSPPQHYEAQVRVYLAITGEPWCDVTVFFRQTAEFRHCRIVANPEVDAGLITLAERWWDHHITQGNPPAVDGSEGATRFLIHRFPRHTIEEALRASPEIDRLGHDLATVRFTLAESEKAEANLKNAIREAMGEYGKIEGTGWSATCRRSKGATKVGWQEIASAYRGLLHQIELALRARGDMEEALRLLTDNPPDAIVGLYTTEGSGSRPFVFRDLGNGGSR